MQQKEQEWKEAEKKEKKQEQDKEDKEEHLQQAKTLWCKATGSQSTNLLGSKRTGEEEKSINRNKKKKEEQKQKWKWREAEDNEQEEQKEQEDEEEHLQKDKLVGAKQQELRAQNYLIIGQQEYRSSREQG